MNPLFPLKVSLDFFIDMKEFYKKYPSTAYRRDLNLYLDTIVYFATKAEIPNLIRRHNHTGSRLDTTNIPKVSVIDPIQSQVSFLPEEINQRFSYSKNVFEGLFITKSFDINFRKRNDLNSQLTLNFNLHDLIQKILKGEASEDEKSKLTLNLDMKTQLLHVEMLADNPVITSSGKSDDFISLYDLQNSIMGIRLDGLVNAPAICKLNEISIYTGYKFSRRTVFRFTNKNVQDICCNEVYARMVNPEEIK